MQKTEQVNGISYNGTNLGYTRYILNSSNFNLQIIFKENGEIVSENLSENEFGQMKISLLNAAQVQERFFIKRNCSSDTQI